jgi:predicted site-specific integrase-resolvase
MSQVLPSKRSMEYPPSLSIDGKKKGWSKQYDLQEETDSTVEVTFKKLFGKSTGEEEEEKTKKRVCYARVSSEKQRPDLECQIQDLKRKKPEYEILSDIGSGLNFKRRNFQRLLEQVHNGNIEEVVVTHKGILTFFSFFLQY